MLPNLHQNSPRGAPHICALPPNIRARATCRGRSRGQATQCRCRHHHAQVDTGNSYAPRAQQVRHQPPHEHGPKTVHRCVSNAPPLARQRRHPAECPRAAEILLADTDCKVTKPSTPLRTTDRSRPTATDSVLERLLDRPTDPPRLTHPDRKRIARDAHRVRDSEYTNRLDCV